MAAPNGDELAPYSIEDLRHLKQRMCKGAGCYGAVYEVSVSGCPCIAKRLHDILVEQTVSVEQKSFIRSRFREECILLSKLRHPNVVQFIGVHYGKTQDDLTLVMEALYIDLDRCLAEQKLFEREIPFPMQLSILLDVSYGLLYLHSQSDPIIHRDLTASNILLTRDMRAKLADLGLSKIMDLHLLRSVAHTVCPGALGVMPPEALVKHPKYDVKLDNFSFGTLVLHVVNYEFPVPYEVPILECQRGKVSVTRRRDAIDRMGESHCLRQLVCRCLHDDPKKRPTTAKIASELEKLSEEHPKQFSDVLEMYEAVKQLTKNAREIAEQSVQLQEENCDLLQKLKSEGVRHENLYKEKMELFEEHALILKQQVEDIAAKGAHLEEENSTLRTELERFKRELKEDDEKELSLFKESVEESDVGSVDVEEGYVFLGDSTEVDVEAIKYSNTQPKKTVLESHPPGACYSELSAHGSKSFEFSTKDEGTIPEQKMKSASGNQATHTTVPQQLLAELERYATANDYYHLLGVEPEDSDEWLEWLKWAWMVKVQELHLNHQKGDPERRATSKHEVTLTRQLFHDVFGSEEARTLYNRLCKYRKLYHQIPDQDRQRLNAARIKLQVFHESMSKIRMPLKLLEEVQLAQSLVEHCLQSPEA